MALFEAASSHWTLLACARPSSEGGGPWPPLLTQCRSPSPPASPATEGPAGLRAPGGDPIDRLSGLGVVASAQRLPRLEAPRLGGSHRPRAPDALAPEDALPIQLELPPRTVARAALRAARRRGARVHRVLRSRGAPGRAPSTHGRVPPLGSRIDRPRPGDLLPRPHAARRPLVPGWWHRDRVRSRRVRHQHHGHRGMADPSVPLPARPRVARDARRRHRRVPSDVPRSRVLQPACGEDDVDRHRGPVGDRRLRRAARVRLADAPADPFPGARDRGARPQAGGERAPSPARSSDGPPEPAVLPAQPVARDRSCRAERRQGRRDADGPRSLQGDQRRAGPSLRRQALVGDRATHLRVVAGGRPDGEARRRRVRRAALGPLDRGDRDRDRRPGDGRTPPSDPRRGARSGHLGQPRPRAVSRALRGSGRVAATRGRGDVRREGVGGRFRGLRRDDRPIQAGAPEARDPGASRDRRQPVPDVSPAEGPAVGRPRRRRGGVDPLGAPDAGEALTRGFHPDGREDRAAEAAHLLGDRGRGTDAPLMGGLRRAHPRRRQPLATQPPRPGPARSRGRTPRAIRRARVAAAARADRELPRRGLGPLRHRAERARRARDRAVDRRLRHRILLPLLPEAAPDRGAQDRSVVRLAHARPGRGLHDRPRNGRAGAQPRSPGRGGGRAGPRDVRPAR